MEIIHQKSINFEIITPERGRNTGTRWRTIFMDTRKIPGEAKVTRKINI